MNMSSDGKRNANNANNVDIVQDGVLIFGHRKNEEMDPSNKFKLGDGGSGNPTQITTPKVVVTKTKLTYIHNDQEVLDNLVNIIEEEIRFYKTYITIFSEFPRTHRSTYHELPGLIENLKDIKKRAQQKNNDSTILNTNYVLTRDLLDVKQRFAVIRDMTVVSLADIVTTALAEKDNNNNTLHTLAELLQSVVNTNIPNSEIAQDATAILKKGEALEKSATLTTGNTEMTGSFDENSFIIIQNDFLPDESGHFKGSHEIQKGLEQTKNNSENSSNLVKDANPDSYVQNFPNRERVVNFIEKEVQTYLTEKINLLQNNNVQCLNCNRCNNTIQGCGRIPRLAHSAHSKHDKDMKTAQNSNEYYGSKESIGLKTDTPTEEFLVETPDNCNIITKEKFQECMKLLQVNVVKGVETVFDKAQSNLIMIGVHHYRQELKTILNETELKLQEYLQHLFSTKVDSKFFIQTQDRGESSTTSIKDYSTVKDLGSRSAIAYTEGLLLNHIKDVKGIVVEELNGIRLAENMIREFSNETVEERVVLLPLRTLMQIKAPLESAKDKLTELNKYLHTIGTTNTTNDHFSRIDQYLAEYMKLKAGFEFWNWYKTIKHEFHKKVDEFTISEKRFLVEQINALNQTVFDLQGCINKNIVLMQRLELEDDSTVQINLNRLEVDSQKPKSTIIPTAEQWASKLSQYCNELKTIYHNNSELDSPSIKRDISRYNSYVIEAFRFNTMTENNVEKNLNAHMAKHKREVSKLQNTIDDLQKDVIGILNGFYSELGQNKKSSLLRQAWNYIKGEQTEENVSQKVNNVISYVRNVENKTIDLEKQLLQKDETIATLNTDKAQYVKNCDDQLFQEREKLNEAKRRLEQQTQDTTNLKETLGCQVSSLNNSLKESVAQNQSLTKDLEQSKKTLDEQKSVLIGYREKLKTCWQKSETMQKAADSFHNNTSIQNIDLSNRIRGIAVTINNHCVEVTIENIRNDMDNQFIERSINAIRDIGEQTNTFKEKLRNFNGASTDIIYLDVKEYLLRFLVNLDNIPSKNKAEIINERKSVHAKVTQLLNILEMKEKR